MYPDKLHQLQNPPHQSPNLVLSRTPSNPIFFSFGQDSYMALDLSLLSKCQNQYTVQSRLGKENLSKFYLLTSCFQLHVTTCWCKHKKNGKIQQKLKNKFWIIFICKKLHNTLDCDVTLALFRKIQILGQLSFVTSVDVF